MWNRVKQVSKMIAVIAIIGVVMYAAYAATAWICNKIVSWFYPTKKQQLALEARNEQQPDEPEAMELTIH